MTTRQSPVIVTAAVIEKDGKILIAKRKHGSLLGGKWEFPGGKLEKGETPEQCLKRELLEEFGIVTEIGEHVSSVVHSYTSEWIIKLMAYRTTVISGIFNLNDHEEIKWVRPADLATYDFPEADQPIVDLLIKEGAHAV